MLRPVSEAAVEKRRLTGSRSFARLLHVARVNAAGMVAAIGLRPITIRIKGKRGSYALKLQYMFLLNRRQITGAGDSAQERTRQTIQADNSGAGLTK